MNKQESVLSYLLTKAGKTFKDLANYIGVEESTPYRWSRGTRVPGQRISKELEGFLGDECGYDIHKVFPFPYSFEEYLAVPVDTFVGNDIKKAVEKFYSPKQSWEVTYGNSKDEKKTKHPVHEYLEDIVGQPITWNAKTIPEYEVDLTVEESSRDGISIHGGGSFGCVAPKSVTIFAPDLQKLIENRFKYFLDTNSMSQFVEVMGQYCNYLNVTNRSW